MQDRKKIIMAVTWRYTNAGALCTAILLLHTLTSVYAAGERQRLADAEKTRHALFLNSWAVKISGRPENADTLARKHGLTNRGQIGNLKGFYLLTDGEEATRKVTKRLSEFATSKTAALREDEMVAFVEQQTVQSRVKKTYFPPPDPGWKKQWSLENTGQTKGPSGLDLKVEPAWIQGVTGRGIVVGFVDDGLEWTHEDLINNYDASASYDFVWYDNDPTPDENSDEPNSHGTSCAGEVAMGRNCSCGIGVAHGCSIGGLKMDFSYSSDSTEADAVGHKDSYIHIYSNSWGPSDYGFTVEGPGALLRETFSNGVKEGRNGKGSIYVWAAGNGGFYYDSCAADGYVNSIYTIAVGSADQNGRQAEYDEDCSAKMAVTFSYNSDTFPTADDTWESYDQVYTTALGGKCIDGFTGTSASTPLVSGVVALVLQANPDLTWRDVQYLIAYTSNPDILTGDDWVANAAGLNVSHHFGFGAIDAEAMVTRARHWINVPEQHKLKVPFTSQTRRVYYSESMPIVVPDGDVGFLEHVVVTMSITVHTHGKEYDYSDFYDELYNYSSDIELVYDWLQSEHPRRGDVKIELTSPAGTKSILLPYRNYDFVNVEGYDNWPFMSVHFWGENPVGTWTLQTTYKSGSGFAVVDYIAITMYGTPHVPSTVSTIPSSCHSSCARGRGCFGEGPKNCDVCNNLRLSSNLECVDECPTGTHIFKKYCLADSDATKCPNKDETESNILTIIIVSSIAVAVLITVITVVSVIVVVIYRRRKKRKTGGFRRLHSSNAIES